MAVEADAYEGNLQSSEASEGSSGDMDERLATLVHLQQLQQKQEVVSRMETETAANADAGFRRGLEELVRDHLNTCMALASCSSLDPGISSSSSSNLMSRPSSYIALHDAAENTHRPLHDQNGDLDAYHTAQSHDDMLDQYDPAQAHDSDVMNDSVCCAHHRILDEEQIDYEHANANQLVQEGREAEATNNHPSTQERPRSSILSIWAAQRAQEMITTMERQAREAELLALNGLHTVSTLDASFLRESLATGDSSLADSSLNGEERRRGRPSSMVQMWRELEERRTERVRHDFEERALPPTDSSRASENVDSSDSSTITHMEDEVSVGQTVFANARDMQTNEDTEVMLQSQNEDYTDWEGNGIERIGLHANSEVSERESAHTQEGEREHVRQIVQRLTTDNGAQAIPSDGHARSRAVWLDENERERVRELAREWVRVTNEQRAVMQDRGGRQRPPRVNRPEQVRERGLTAQTESLNGNSVQGLSRRERRFLNRQVILDMLMRVENERQRELQLLVEHRAVSDFAHRHRLQSFLRGRFLRTGAVTEEERVPSSAAGELGQLRQRRAVSDLREGFRFRLESIIRGQVNNRDVERTNTHGPTQRRRRRRSEDQPAVQNFAGEGPSGRWAQQESVSRNWQGNPTPRRVAEFQTMEESTENNMELQELLGRRSVTNVLASEFRDRLDRLIRSFLQTQGRSPVAWDVPRTEAPQPPPQPQQRPRQQAQWQQEVRARQPHVIPPPPPPPPQPLWQQELQQGLWQRPPPSLHRSSYTEGEAITDLRTDVSKLQQGMADLHRMMETCLEMQLDLQRSLRQELAGALQQVYEGKVIPDGAIDGSKWTSVKRGICCVCCDRNIDSLLYRCGHMCTCLNCASELIRKSGKCPMCRAPIKEVVRAFTVV